VVGVKEGSQQVFTVFIENAGLAREHLQNGGAVEKIVWIAFRENFEHDYIKGDVANKGYEKEGDCNFNELVHAFRNLLADNGLQNIKVLGLRSVKRLALCKKYAYLKRKTTILPITP
jgi:hypothetical protein